MPISEICNREVVIISAEDSGFEAARLMREHHVGDVIVTEDRDGKRVPIGIVTDRDIIMEIIALGLDPKVITTGDIMASELATVDESKGVFEAIQYMRGKGIRRLPVVDGNRELVGIVTMDDLLALLADELNSLAKLIGHEQQKEARSRHA